MMICAGLLLVPPALANPPPGDTAQLERLTCPIGVPGITGKHPGAIAVAAVAQLLQAYERAAAGRPTEAPATVS